MVHFEAAMTAVILLGFLLGLDNLEVGAGLGLVRMSTARRWAFAGVSALCETVMPLVGLALGHAARLRAGGGGEGLGVAVLGLCGVVISTRRCAATRRRKNASPTAASPWQASRCLSSWQSGGRSGPRIARLSGARLGPVLGPVSGSLCALGLFSGGQLRRWIPKRAELLGGIYLLALAVFRLLELR